MARSERSFRASTVGLEKAKKAFKLKGWTQDYLAGAVGCSRQTMINFFARRPVDKDKFQDICTELGLEWGEIAELETGDEKPTTPTTIDALVNQVREKVSADIQKRCGWMRVLDMTQPIGLNDIYTDVNILKEITGRERLEITQLLENFNPEGFERFGLNQVRGKRVSGLTAVEQHSKLMILGKPGAGKTTFLKRIAIQCKLGNFLANYVPIFITLKDFAEEEGKPSLLQYINNQFVSNNISDQEITKTLLLQGRAIVLLDGLDEVKQEDNDRVLREIRNFSTQYDANHFVITCRIASNQYVFQGFTDVEVADFKDKQIEEFARKWFKTKDPNKAQQFIQKLQKNKRIKELATNPLLLTLLCLLFGESTNFPSNRSELYQEGVDVLLKKWDGTRSIEREQVYKKLSYERKEDLLSTVALTTFESGNYFFKEELAKGYIRDYIQNLPDAQTDSEALLLDSAAVLKSIEAQHGLLVERARGIYSFSHLTFHEFFTARNIALSRNPQQVFQQLVSHITDKRWREVFLLAVGKLNNADDLLQLMKQQIDRHLADDKKLQQFLTWINEKSCSVETRYKPAAVRAFYLSLSLDLDLDLSFSRSLDLSRPLDLEFKRSLQQLKDQLPDPSKDKKALEAFKQWWQTNGQAWTEHLRTVIIEHRNIGHDWQFSDIQKELLQQYHNANKLLIDCLNSECYVSRSVREEIENTLLLPINGN
nr:NACHT domain-containing NTPase [Nostoc sp. ChiQUE02]MDZ8232713.1 NACHT domain-containing NTPase [Nostoc sp. ChiQUE02]